jgi:chaperonin GroEL
MRKAIFGNEARAKALAGAEVLFNSVAPTMGPKGRCVLLEKHPLFAPVLTLDGVTVAKEVRDMGCPFMDMAINLLREAASKTADMAGDGTTTSVVLAYNIYREGLKHIENGANPMALKKGIERGVEAVVNRLKEIAIPVTTDEQIIQIGALSAHGDRSIGELVLSAMRKVGRDGVITLGESADVETRLEFVEGMQIDRGLIAMPMITNPERMECVLENPYILLTERKLMTVTKELAALLEEVIETRRPILFVAGEYDQPFVVALIHNKQNGVFLSAAVKAPAFGDQRKSLLEDMGCITGGYAFTEDCGRKLESVQIEDLGQASRVVITRDSTTITGGMGRPDYIAQRVELLRTLTATAKDDLERERCRQRLAKLASGVAILKVGAQTEVEQREKRDRIEDAVQATRAAVEEGILPGGGLALLSCSYWVDRLIPQLTMDEELGAKIIRRAVEAPMRQIITNAGSDYRTILSEVCGFKKPWYMRLWDMLTGREFHYVYGNNVGYNAATERYEDLIASGVIDPAKVTRVALQNAASVAASLLTTEAMVANMPEKR